MNIVIILVITTILSAIGCGLTPDNLNIAICLVLFISGLALDKYIENQKNKEIIYYNRNKYSNQEEKEIINNDKSRIVFIIVAAILTIVMSSFSKVETGHTGIMVSFGKTDTKTYSEGIVLKPLWKNMIQVDNRIQKNGHDDQPLSLTAFTKDTQQVSIKYTVNYRINKENASKLYKEIGLDYFKTVLTPIIQESVKIECAKYTANELLENRDKMAIDIEKDIREKFNNNYIDLTATAIEDLSFSDEYEKAVEQKQVALQDKLKAEQEAEKKKVVADADAYVKVAEAKAEAEANELRQKTLTDLLVKDKMIDKWDGKLPQYQGGTTPIIDLR